MSSIDLDQNETIQPGSENVQGELGAGSTKGHANQTSRERKFQQIYEQYFDLVFYVVKRCGLSAEPGLDVVHDTFLKFYSRSDDIRDASKVKAWLLTTARNACMDVLRKQTLEAKHRQRVYHMGDQETSSDIVSDSLWREVELQLVGDLLLELKQEAKDDTFWLFYKEGLSVKQIAETHGLPVSTVTNRLSRFRKQYRDRLRKHIQRLKDNAF